MNSVEPRPTSSGRKDTKATFPFSGHGVIFANNVSPTRKRDSPEPSSILLSKFRMPPKFSPTAAISMKG